MITNIRDLVDTIRFNKNKISLKVIIASGKEGDYFVVVSPSLDVSGYGKTKEMAQESFKENIKTFCEDLFKLSKEDRDKELFQMGFHREALKNKNFSKSFVDENGVLKDFDEGTLEQKILETSACL